MEKIFAELASINPRFEATGVFQNKEIIPLLEKYNLKFNDIIEHSTKMSRGVWKRNDIDVSIKPSEVSLVVPDKLQDVFKPAPKQAVQQNSSFASVPLLDEYYIPFGAYKDVETIIASKQFYPVLITGHSGNGKTMSVEQACARNNRPFMRINCTKKTDEETLIGSKTIIDGNVVVVEGPMLTAMRSGAVISLDEFSASDPNAILMLQGIMEGKPYFYAPTSEYIVPAKGFNVFLTDNTKGQGSEDGRYVGTNIINEAFLERIGMTIEQEFPTESVELKILQRRMMLKGAEDQDFAKSLVKWAAAIRKTFDDGGIDSVISTRRLGHIIDHFAIFKNKTKAVEQCTARFDEMTKMAFREFWDKISVEPVTPQESDND